MTAPESALLDLHRKLVETPSVSHEEKDIADFIAEHLSSRGEQVERIGLNVVARKGPTTGPCLLLNSHFDTVPSSAEWTRDPFKATTEGDRIYGLGSNDAKASVASMMRAFLQTSSKDLTGELVLMLVPDEETGGQGTELAWPALEKRGLKPDGVVVGEPTALNIASSQKGMCVVSLEAAGDPCHSANARDLGAINPIRVLAEDLVSLSKLDLGATTLEPTIISGGEIRNRVPGKASVTLDMRTDPESTHEDLIARVRQAVTSPVKVISDRLRPIACPDTASILSAAREAAPEATVFGSKTMSDMVFFSGIPAIKCGPGQTARSHTPDEFILESELLAGLGFYQSLIKTFFRSP